MASPPGSPPCPLVAVGNTHSPRAVVGGERRVPPHLSCGDFRSVSPWNSGNRTGHVLGRTRSLNGGTGPECLRSAEPWATCEEVTAVVLAGGRGGLVARRVTSDATSRHRLLFCVPTPSHRHWLRPVLWATAPAPGGGPWPTVWGTRGRFVSPKNGFSIHLGRQNGTQRLLKEAVR